MSLRRREQLVRLARQHDALVMTDDVYDMLQWPSCPRAAAKVMDKAIVPRIVDVDRYLDGGPIDKWGNAVSNGSFSKIIGPGCRTGWAEGTESLVYGLSQTGSSRSGGAPSQLVASFIHDARLSRNSNRSSMNLGLEAMAAPPPSAAPRPVSVLNPNITFDAILGSQDQGKGKKGKK